MQNGAITIDTDNALVPADIFTKPFPLAHTERCTVGCQVRFYGGYLIGCEVKYGRQSVAGGEIHTVFEG